MLTSVRSLLAASFFATTAVFAAPAMAQETIIPDPSIEEDDGSEFALSANVGLVSEYKFRGVGLSDSDIAIQGGIDLSLPKGFYLGTWASSIDEDTVGFGHTELDLYGGWAGDIGAVSADVGAIYYAFPNADGGLDTDYIEFYGSLGHTFGPVETTVGVAYAPDQDSLGDTDNFYVYGDVGVGFAGTPITVTGHLGYTDGFLTFTEDSEAFDYSIGAEFAIPDTPVSVGVAYVGVEGDGLIDPDGTFTDDSVVFSISASF